MRELERPEDDQERDEQAGEEVVAADLIVGEIVGGPRHDETRSDPVRSRWPRRRFVNASENTSVTMPVKMMPSERRTATQLSSPPMIAALAVPTTTPAAIGSEVSSVRITAP